ncbi:hypothetical protein EYF80_056528 [Liparis tanakae]|uniref:Uncharacterized protein n=1 Tax=Liparis tanakae TaxID=230148 RepID=A0A4Z2EWX5_9TELE|nr:hypothetical protein EYF80_056528 [Liparis tanakae]
MYRFLPAKPTCSFSRRANLPRANGSSQETGRPSAAPAAFPRRGVSTDLLVRSKASRIVANPSGVSSHTLTSAARHAEGSRTTGPLVMLSARILLRQPPLSWAGETRRERTSHSHWHRHVADHVLTAGTHHLQGNGPGLHQQVPVVVLIRKSSQRRPDGQFGRQHFPPDGHAPLRSLQGRFQLVVQDVTRGHQLHHLFVAEETGSPLQSDRGEPPIYQPIKVNRNTPYILYTISYGGSPEDPRGRPDTPRASGPLTYSDSPERVASEQETPRERKRSSPTALLASPLSWRRDECHAKQQSNRIGRFLSDVSPFSPRAASASGGSSGSETGGGGESVVWGLGESLLRQSPATEGLGVRGELRMGLIRDREDSASVCSKKTYFTASSRARPSVISCSRSMLLGGEERGAVMAGAHWTPRRAPRAVLTRLLRRESSVSVNQGQAQRLRGASHRYIVNMLQNSADQ